MSDISQQKPFQIGKLLIQSLILDFKLVGMARLKCKKCGNVYDYEYKVLASLVHLGPYKRIQCPACGKSSFVNVYSSVKEPVTWPPEVKHQQQVTQPQLTEEEMEKKRIEESKYEKA